MSTALADLGDTAGTPRPLAPFALAATVERLGDAWPRALVPTRAVDAIIAFAGPLPPTFHWLMLETRLTPDQGDRVDLLAAIIDQGEPARPAAWDPVPRAPLVEHWLARRDPLLSDAQVLWLEWDAPFRDAPLQIASLDRRFWGARHAKPALARQLALYEAIHRASFGCAHDERVLGRLGDAIGALPARASALFGASLAPRGRACDRLFVELPRAEVLAWLRAVGWPGDDNRAATWLLAAVAAWEMAYVQIEITPDGPTPYLAIESRQTSGARSERRVRAAFLDRLVAEGVVPKERAYAALAWEGARRVGACSEVRSVHLKCAWSESSEVEVKAYLGVHYRAAINRS